MLSTYTKEILGTFQSLSSQVIHTLYREKSEFDTLFTTVATLHANGVPVDWKQFYSTIVPHASLQTLPTYPWQRYLVLTSP